MIIYTKSGPGIFDFIKISLMPAWNPPFVDIEIYGLFNQHSVK